MPYRLTLQLPEGPRRYPLGNGDHVLGSEASNDIRIRHMMVSRRHARFRVTADGLWIEDLGSSNGTTVDNKRLKGERRLEVPCRVSFGGVQGEISEISAGDLVSAVRVSPLTVRPEETSDGLSDAGGRTLSSSSLEELTLRRLPGLVEGLAEGSGPTEAAQRVGADLFQSLPCYELEIWNDSPGGRAVWFSARTDAQPNNTAGLITEQAGSLGIRAGFVQKALAAQLAPLIRVGLHLVRWAARDPATEPSRPAKPRPIRAEAPTPLPEPATIDLNMQSLYAQADRVARSDIGILIFGESGTGKEVTARFIHRASGKGDAPFVAINCAALPRDLLEVELFGIEKAVATGVDARPGKFELAHGGTLLLDEIGDMALETQAKILRVLQEGELFRIGGREPRPARPRVLAATHCDLEAMIQEGSFRRDLYYRLAGWTLKLPALRERSADLPNLAARFLTEEAASLGRDLPGISLAAMDALVAYDWPGNIRELRHEISRAALFLNDGELLDSSRLSDGLKSAEAAHPDSPLKDRLEQFERSEIQRAIDRAAGDVPKAAELLGVGRSTLYRRMKALGLQGAAPEV